MAWEPIASTPKDARRALIGVMILLTGVTSYALTADSWLAWSGAVILSLMLWAGSADWVHHRSAPKTPPRT